MRTSEEKINLNTKYMCNIILMIIWGFITQYGDIGRMFMSAIPIIIISGGISWYDQMLLKKFGHGLDYKISLVVQKMSFRIGTIMLCLIPLRLWPKIPENIILGIIIIQMILTVRGFKILKEKHDM